MTAARELHTGTVLATELRPAHTHWTRLRGLLGTRRLEPGQGLWLRPCRQVHTIGMRYPIDVAFLDAEYRVVRAISGLSPGRVSPRVADATSVLELPPGTIARSRLAPGAQLAIDGDLPSPSSRAQGVAAILCNLVIASLYGFFAAAHVTVARTRGEWATTLPIIAQELLLVALFLTRRRATTNSARPLEWAVGVAGTVLPLLLRPTAAASSFVWLGQSLQFLGVVAAVIALAFLGRSIGVVPANRGVKTAGPYLLVRHPMYAAYLVSYTGYLICYPDPRNGLLLATTLAAVVLRARFEERFLSRDPLYQDYLQRVRWRFVPFVL